MAHTNQTPNYELTQFLGTDKPAWLVDYNGDMEKIDLGLKAAKDVADAAKEEADQGAIDIAAVTLTANAADTKASGAISDLADTYDATSTYNVGDFVIYNNILYRCITAITVPESFDGTHWTRTTVEEIITQINSDLNTKESKIKAVFLTDFTTDVHGRIITDIDVSNKVIVSILTTTNGEMALQLRTNAKVLAFTIIDSLTFQPVPNVQRSFTYYYFDI